MTEQQARNAWRDADALCQKARYPDAIALYLSALGFFSEKDHPTDWAAVQNNLGAAYRNLPTGDKGENLAKAIECYQAALRVYTEEASPAQWAMTQNNLGNAYSDLPTGDKGENLAKAIECYQAALRVRTEEASPADWAMTQNNLGLLGLDHRAAVGLTWQDLWDRTAAIALTQHVRALHPDELRRALRLLARIAQQQRWTKKGPRVLRTAVEHYRAARLSYLAEYAETLATQLRKPKPKRIAPPERDQIVKAYAAGDRITKLSEHLAEAQKQQEHLAAMLAQPATLDPAGAGALWVLQQWNSFTPLLATGRTDARQGTNENRGGGYFLVWRGKGIVIDPGPDFIRNLRESKRSLLDINAIVLTHNHLDHVGDVIPILTLLHEYNERHPDERHTLTMACSPSTFSMFADLAAHARWIKHFMPLRPDERVGLPGTEIEIAPFHTQHAELGGRSAALGLRLILKSEEGSLCRVAMPGDGGWTDSLCHHCEGADLLVLHLGGMYPQDIGPDQFATDHLGTKGVFGLLWQLQHRESLPKLTLIAELGEELAGREEFIADECCAGLSVEYRKTLIEARLNRAITLPELKVMCERGLNDPSAQRCFHPAELREWEHKPGESRHAYLCDTHKPR
ncbi:MAG: tetratricopeptide repeat protein [Armatimonadota bacterium]|nr:MAG: tetratricopeptide repeat protein [Armatimonadota bacterium]